MATKSERLDALIGYLQMIAPMIQNQYLRPHWMAVWLRPLNKIFEGSMPSGFASLSR